MQEKNTSAKLCAKNAGGTYARGGAYLRDTTVHTERTYRCSSTLENQGNRIKRLDVLTSVGT